MLQGSRLLGNLIRIPRLISRWMNDRVSTSDNRNQWNVGHLECRGARCQQYPVPVHPRLRKPGGNAFLFYFSPPGFSNLIASCEIALNRAASIPLGRFFSVLRSGPAEKSVATARWKTDVRSLWKTRGFNYDLTILLTRWVTRAFVVLSELRNLNGSYSFAMQVSKFL